MNPEEAQPLPELAPDVRELLAYERAGASAPAEAQARVWQAVAGTVPAVAGTVASGAAVGSALRRWLTSKVVGAAIAFGAGTGAGAVLHARLGRPAAGPPPLPAVIAPAPPASPQIESKPAAPPPRPPRPAPVPATGDAALAAERRLIEQARSALARGQPEASLEALGEHGRLHPGGKLAEEREALRVQALVTAGRADDARTAARAFHKKYPESMLGSAVDAALREP
jgi:hypothetical protein